jgi:hypothetical protein
MEIIHRAISTHIVSKGGFSNKQAIMVDDFTIQRDFDFAGAVTGA